MAHVTDLGFTLDDLEKAIADDEVRSQVHPEFPEFAIFNYTEGVQYANRWNNITLACRGLILNTDTGEVVARPWEKFFNLEQMDNRIDSYAPVEVTDKIDGSLGILYALEPDGKYSAIATRGSFASEQAAHATKVWAERYWAQVNTSAIVDFTFLFEIVYPDNRIVVNYGDMDDLVLLGAVHKQHGYYLGPLEAQGVLGWTGPVTEVFKYDTFLDAISAPDRPGKEGYVIRSGRNMVKLKQADYVELHRIVTNLSPRTIWEMMGNGKTIADICAQIPDEFHSYVEDIGNDLIIKASGIVMDANIIFSTIRTKLWSADGSEISRRQWAEEIKKHDNAPLLFLLLDGKDIEPVVWQSIRPRGDVKTLVKEDA